MIRRLAAGAALGLMLLGTLAPGASAGVVGRTAQTGYFCDIAQNGSSSPIDSDSMTLAMTLDVPTSVTPGERVDLRGELSLAFPESMSQDAKGFVTTANGYSDSMSLQLGVNGGVTNVIADRWQTPEVPVGDPIVVHAPIAFPPITIPAAARGDVTLTMAQNNVLKNPNFPTPKVIAFAAAAQASGPVGTFNFNLSCYLKGKASPSMIAKIPVVTAASSHSTHAATLPPAQANGTTSTQAGQGATTTTGSTSASKKSHSRGKGGTSSAATVTGRSGSNGMTATYADSDDTQHGGIYVPTGVLVGLGVLVCVCALTYAAWANYRLRALRRFLDD